VEVCLRLPGETMVAGLSPVRILFVGGDERQALHDERVRKMLEGSYPWIEVRFIHTGWTSNWGKSASQIARLIPNYSALVVMSFVPTKLGRAVRKAAGRHQTPWHACTGRGPESIVNSIVSAARLAG
jgi:hypothetical protein